MKDHSQIEKKVDRCVTFRICAGCRACTAFDSLRHQSFRRNATDQCGRLPSVQSQNAACKSGRCHSAVHMLPVSSNQKTAVYSDTFHHRSANIALPASDNALFVFAMLLSLSFQFAFDNILNNVSGSMAGMLLF